MRHALNPFIAGWIAVAVIAVSAQGVVPKHDSRTLIVQFDNVISGKALARQAAADVTQLPHEVSDLGQLGIDGISPLFPYQAKAAKSIAVYDSLGLSQFFVVLLNDSTTADVAMDQLALVSFVKAVEFNSYYDVLGASVTPNDTWYHSRQWDMKKIQMGDAWSISTGSQNVVVGVLDTGTDYYQPDLADRIGYNLAELNGFAGLDDDFNGLIDDVAGWDFGNDDYDPFPDILWPNSFHGTHVAGTIGASSNNGLGVAGVDWSCWLLTIKVFNSVNGLALTSDIIHGVNYGVYMGCRVLNMSLGGPYSGSQEENALLAALANAKLNGVLVVAAMGNRDDASTNIPAASPHVMAVGATDSLDRRWLDNDTSGSDFGSHIDIVAPGAGIYSTMPCVFSCPNGLYDYSTGTSMAAPHVAGLAALVLSVRPTVSVDSLYWYIAHGADDLRGLSFEDTPGWDPYHGWGRINAYNSIRLALGQCVCKCFGDPKCDGSADILDVVQVVGEAFRNVTPAIDYGCPSKRMDLNADGNVDVLDVVKMVGVAFRNLSISSQFVDPCE